MVEEWAVPRYHQVDSVQALRFMLELNPRIAPREQAHRHHREPNVAGVNQQDRALEFHALAVLPKPVLGGVLILCVARQRLPYSLPQLMHSTLFLVAKNVTGFSSPQRLQV